MSLFSSPPLYTSEACVPTAAGYTCRLGLNAQHPIYAAHFPGNPVTPGAVTVQLVKEMAAACLARPMVLTALRNVKFVQVLNPRVHPRIDIHLQIDAVGNGWYTVGAVVTSDEVVFAKMSLQLAEEDER